MKEIRIKKYIRYLFVITILIFVLNKFFLRPWVLEKELSEFFRIVVLSLPNLAEAIIGTLLFTGILTQMRQYFNKHLGNLNDTTIHLAAVGLAGVYTISQEYKLHNLGGNNVFDMYDVIASVIGLVIAFGLIKKFGFLEKETKP